MAPLTKSDIAQIKEVIDDCLNKKLTGLIPETINKCLEEKLKTVVKSIVQECVNECKDELTGQILNKVSGEVDTLKRQLSDRDAEVKHLREMMTEARRDNVDKEERLSDLEQLQHKDDLIISQNGLPNTTGATDKERIASAIRTVLHVNVKQEDIKYVRKIGSPRTSGPDNRPLLFSLPDAERRREIFQSCKQVKPAFHINESLTPYRRELLKTLRAIRKDDRSKIPVLFTKGGVIHAATSPNTRLQFIRTTADLNEFVRSISA